MILDDDWPDLPDLVDRVQEMLDLGLFDEAQLMLNKYQSFFQNCWEFHFLCSRIYTEQNEPRKAIPCLLQGLRLERDNADCLLGLFYAHVMMGRVKRGGRFLLRAESLYPEHEQVLSALVWYYTEVNEPDRAIRYFERAQEINLNNPVTYRNAGIAFDRLGRFEDAEMCYKAALEINPSFDEARDLYADHLIFTGKTDAAVKLYENALEESPKNIRHLSKLIYCLSQTGRFDRAETLAKRSISLYPNSPLGYIDLAYVNLNTGNTGAAVENADKAIAIAPIDAEGYRVKAVACSDRGDFDVADELFEKAITLDPENIDIMRDYYRHLRISEKYDLMIAVVEKVIKMEYPYCTEDYWFMADYYREKKQNVNAFHYLRLAYNLLPTEKELLPPMIEILLEQGHAKFSQIIFASYVHKSGWTEAMNNFSRRKQFKDSDAQEGMRFLRFTGLRPMEYRKYIFNHYLYRFGLMYYTLFAVALMFPASVLFGWLGVGGVTAVYTTSLCAIKIFQVIKIKKAIARSNRSQQTVKGAA